MDKKVLELNFLESGRVKLLVNPVIRTETFWRKLKEDGTEIPLPEGISDDQNDLIIWSAADNHNGRYVGYVMNVDDGKPIGMVETEVKVAPMRPDVKKDIFNASEIKNTSIGLYVPDSVRCQNQTWELVDASNKSTDITNFGDFSFFKLIIIVF